VDVVIFSKKPVTVLQDSSFATTPATHSRDTAIAS